MEEEREQWEELIRSKLYDFEVDVPPEEWIALSSKMEGGKVIRVNFYRRLTYAVSAAAVIALLFVGGWYLFSDRMDVSDALIAVEKPIQQSADKISNETEYEMINVDTPVDNTVEKPVDQLLAVTKKPDRKVTEKEKSDIRTPSTLIIEDEKEQQTDLDATVLPEKDIAPERIQDIYSSEQTHLASVSPETKRRRWGFGFGGGGYAVGSTTGASPLSPSSGLLRDDEYMFMTARNASLSGTILDPIDGFDNRNYNMLGKIKHKRPLSVGFGVSYYLTDRWTLQSGMVYTLLRSKGSFLDDAGTIAEWKQNLHFIGIPLSAAYTIADWKRIRFYVSAGGMVEWNIAGKRMYIVKVENLETIENEKMRIKEPLWSVHSRAGATYPLWRFINLYAEAGVSYYFDYKSEIETIRSDKPFNVSLQAGFRLGF